MITPASAETIVAAARLLGRHGELVEARILKAPRGGTVSGYFTDVEALAAAVAPWDGRATIYVTLNPVRADLLARAANRLESFARATTADVDIVRRVWFPLDLDAARPAGISATDAEVAAALVRRNDVLAFLAELGFPDVVRAMSGNGGHALAPIDLPNDGASARLLEGALTAIASRFSDDVVRVDTAVFNAARIWKLYGTVAVKGDATPERPHRRAELEHVPETLQLVTRDVLEALAAMVPPPARTVSVPGARALQPLDLVELVQARGWYLRPLHGSGKHAIVCPWADAHSSDSGLTETVIFEPRAAGDPWGFDCKHAHCTGRTIRDLLALLSPVPSGGRAAPAARPEPTNGNGQRPHVAPADLAARVALPDWPLYDAADDWAFPPPQFAIEALLPLYGTVWIGALPKRGKSLLVLYLCLAIACRRTEVAKRFKVFAYPKILYITREDGGSRVQERRDDICAAWGMRPEPGALRFVIRSAIDLQDPVHVAWLRDTCVREGRTLLVIDTWTALSPSADPMSPKDQAQLAAIVVQLAADIGGTVIVIDHSRKNRPEGQVLSSSDILGPSQKWASAEHIVMLDHAEDRRRLEVFIESKDSDGERFLLTVSARGSKVEKFTHAGAVENLAEERRAIGDANRQAVLDTLLANVDGLSMSHLVTTLEAGGLKLGRATILRHVTALTRRGRVRQAGKGRDTRYFARLDGGGLTTSGPCEAENG